MVTYDKRLTREDFEAKVLADLANFDKGVIVEPEAVLSQWTAYPGALEEYKQRAAEIGRILSAETRKDANDLLTAFFSGENIAVTPEGVPPQIPAEERQALPKDAPAIPEYRIKELRTALNTSIEHRNKTISQNARENAKRFTDGFFKRVEDIKLYGNVESTAQTAFEKPVIATGEKEAREQLVARFIQTNASLQAPQVKEIITDLITEKDAPYVREIWNPIDVTVVRSLADPSINVSAYSETLEKLVPLGQSPDQKTLETAVAEARAATVVRSPKLNLSGIKFSDLTANPLIGTLSNIAAPLASREKVFEKAFSNAMESMANVENPIAEKLVGSEVFKKSIQSWNRTATERSAAGGAANGLESLVANIVEPVKLPPSEAMQHYMTQLLQTGKTPNPIEYIGVLYLLNHPTEMAIGAGGAVGSTLSLGASVTASKAVSGVLGKLVGALGLSSGPLAPVLTPVLMFLSDKVITKIVEFGGGMLSGFFYVVGGGFLLGEEAPWTSELLLLPILLVGGIALFFTVHASPISITGRIAEIRSIALATSLWDANFNAGEGQNAAGFAPGLGGNASNYVAPNVSMAPAQYNGPQPSGSLAACLNYNVSGSYGNPLPASYANELNYSINQYPQLGLYNCLLQCPQTQISIYNNGGGEGDYGKAPATGVVIFYNHLFQSVPVDTSSPNSNNVHAMARIIGHEFAHQLTYYHPEVKQAFMNGTTGSDGIITSAINKGYCGHPLCTYPSGFYKSSLNGPGGCDTTGKAPETSDETFAEAAAMYLTGEDLNALCPSSYQFMQQLFGQCAAPSTITSQ